MKNDYKLYDMNRIRDYKNITLNFTLYDSNDVKVGGETFSLDDKETEIKEAIKRIEENFKNGGCVYNERPDFWIWESLSDYANEMGCPDEKNDFFETTDIDVTMDALEMFLETTDYYDYIEEYLTEKEFKEFMQLMEKIASKEGYAKILDVIQDILVRCYPEYLKVNLIPEAVEKLGLND